MSIASISANLILEKKFGLELFISIVSGKRESFCQQVDHPRGVDFLLALDLLFIILFSIT